jgi:SOUL heme-binding protein
MLGCIATFVSQLAEAATSVVGLRGGTEEPPYTVQATIGGVQIRRYAARIAAQTTVPGAEERARNVAFRRLAGYIFGANRAKSTIAMTAPVSQQPSQQPGSQRIAMTAPVSQEPGPEGAWLIRFFMPAKWTLDTLPTPDDDAVTLVAVPAETVAVLRFTGNRGPRAIASHTSDLLRTLQDSEYAPTGPTFAWFYDPPWTIPLLRRNEVAVPVAHQ